MAGLETKTNLYINAGFKGRIGIVVGAKMYPSTTLNCTLPGLFGERHFHTSTDRKSEHCQSFYLLKFSFSEEATKMKFKKSQVLNCFQNKFFSESLNFGWKFRILKERRCCLVT